MGYSTSAPSRARAGSRKRGAGPRRRRAAPELRGRVGVLMGTSALVRGGRGGFQPLGGAVDVGRVRQEVLEELPLAAALGAAEGGGGLVGEVEAEAVGG